MSVYQFLEEISQEKKGHLTRASEESKIVETLSNSTSATMFLLLNTFFVLSTLLPILLHFWKLMHTIDLQ